MARLALCLLFFVLGSVAQQDLKALRPCFERYPNNRLVNVRPYHSEWRMTTEEHCLKFCANTASRCRSVVFDSVQHICHFFLDDGLDTVIAAPKMIYLRVANVKCLENAEAFLEAVGDDGNSIAAPVQELVVPTPTEEPVTVPVTKTSMTFNTTPTTTSTEVIKNEGYTEEAPHNQGDADMIQVDSDSAVANAERNQRMRDMNNFEDGKRWQSSMERIEKNEDDRAFKQNREDKKVKMGIFSSSVDREPVRRMEAKQDNAQEEVEDVSREKITENKNTMEERIRKSLEMLKERYPNRYVEYLGSEETSTQTEPTTTTEATARAQRRSKTMAAKKIQFSDNIVFRKKGKNRSELRRKEARPQLKPVSLSASVKDKARSFLDCVNGNADVEPLTTVAPPPRKIMETAVVMKSNRLATKNGCADDQSAVWMTFQNSLDADQLSIDSSYAATVDDCKQLCNEMNCTSFSFFDKDSQCQINTGSEGVHLKEPRGVGTASTSTKFCFSNSLPIFAHCTTFIGFREYALQVKPTEEFEGLPKSYAGLQLCLEVCALTTQFTCKSASFIMPEGKCMLNSEDSASKADDFAPSLMDGHLYFENSCNSPENLTYREKEAQTIERVSVAPVQQQNKMSPLKILQIKPIKG